MENRFAFGKNWKNYLDSHSSVSVGRATQALEDFLSPETLKGKTFLDVGCGSGVHSLAALKLGAGKVVSIDFDKDSVDCCNSLKEKYFPNEDWVIREGSMLDDEFMRSLGKFDVVYCWGVAHHTGDMWQALKNLNIPIADGGFLFVAIYNYLEGKWGSRYWHKIKEIYNRQNFFGKKVMEYTYISIKFFQLIIRLKNPFKVMKDFSGKRGMKWTTDIIDWLGGFPYEYARAEDIFHFYKNEYGLEMLKLKTTNYIGNNQLLFVKR